MTTEPAIEPGGPARPGGTEGIEPPPPITPEGGKAKVSLADQAFKNLTRACGVLLLLLIVAIAVFLVVKATGALGANKGNFFTTKTWNPNDIPPVFGIAALLSGTVITAAIAMLLAVPVGVGIALCITNYAPRRVADPIAYVVDLLAAVPSVVYGLWGLVVLVPHMTGVESWMNQYLLWFPWPELAGAIIGFVVQRVVDRGTAGSFATTGGVLGLLVGIVAGITSAPDNIGIFNTHGVGTVGRGIFVASVVLAVMILPTIAAISREVFRQVPTAHKEAALALGATRWEMIRTSVLPYGQPGVISGAMLGLGRAMGETIAVALVLPASFNIPWRVLTPAGNTIAANIANAYGEANDNGRGALIASGLVLFVVTMIVNMAARAVIARRAEFSGSAT
jgi:phosphate transport system permease protein